MSLWGQVITLRGQILESRTDDATLRVLCCVLCVCSLYVVCCCGCAMCWCWCVRLTPLLSTHPRLSPPCVRSKRPPCAHSKRPCLYQHHARKCYHMRAWCRYTRGRFECTHAGYRRATPHHTHTPRPQRHTRHNNNHHNNTGTDRDRQTERDREEDRERDVMQNVLRVRQISTNRRVSELTRSR